MITRVIQLWLFLKKRSRFVDEWGWEIMKLRREMIGTVCAIAGLAFCTGTMEAFGKAAAILGIAATLLALYGLVRILSDALLLPLDSFELDM